MNPQDLPRTPSLAQVLQLALDNRLAEVHIGLPGRVEAYDKDKQTVDVQPLVMARVTQEDGTVVAESLPVLSGIPVEFPGAGGMRIILPIQKGDTGRIMFTESSIDSWQKNGGEVDPEDSRRFHLSDATFLPGLKDDSKPWKVDSGDDASFGKDGAHQVVITPDIIELGGNSADRPSDAIALAPATNKDLGKLHDAFKSFVDTYNNHTHIVTGIATAGSAVAQSQTAPVPTQQTTSTATGPDSMDDVSSSKVRSK